MRLPYLFLLFLLFGGWIMAQDYSRPEIALDSLNIFTLDNQLTVALIADHQTPNIHMQLWIPGRSTKMGHLTAALLSEGAKSKSNKNFTAFADSLGLRLSSSYAGITLQGRLGQDSLMMQMIVEMMDSIRFDSSVMATIQQEIALKEKIMGQDPLDKVNDFMDRSWAPVSDTLLPIDSLNTLRYFQHFYRPEKAILIVIGAMEKKDSIVKSLLGKTFAKWAPRQNKPKVDSLFQYRSKTIPNVSVIQGPFAETIFLKYFIPVAYKDSIYPEPPLEILNYLLGGHPKSYLNENLRESNGFSLGMLSRFFKKDTLGWISVQGGVGAQHLGNAILQIQEEINRFKTDVATQEELYMAVNTLKTRFLKRIGQPDYVADLVLQTIKDSLARDYFADYPEELDSTTAQDLLKTANRYLDLSKGKLVLFGDPQQINRQLSLIGQNNNIAYFDETGRKLDFQVYEKFDSVQVDSLVKRHLEVIAGDKSLDSLRSIATTWEAD